jgi:hypothetical protein
MEAVTEFERVDPFRGTAQRWMIDAGPLAGTICDCTFNEDWSIAWRIVAGTRQGQAGRARTFKVERLRTRLYLATFALADDTVVVAAVDFASGRLAGYATTGNFPHAIGGSFIAL